MNRLLRFVFAPLTGWINFAVLVVLVVLKCTHVIPWSWWWVLVPMWLSMAVGLVVGAVAVYVLVVTVRRGGG